MPSNPSDTATPCAIILAAGVGRRLGGAEGDHLPKALLAFGGKSLMARHIGILRGAGITDITVVIGYQAERMRTALAALDDGPAVATLLNPDFREGSVVSLWAGREVLRRGRPVILMDADVIYGAGMMERLIASRWPGALLLDRELEPGDEPVKLCVRDGRIVDFRKQPTEPHEWHGESVGFFRFTPGVAEELATRVEDYVATGRRMMEYEEPIRDMIMSSPGDRFGFEDISGMPWTEIDFPEDVVKANALLAKIGG